MFQLPQLPFPVTALEPHMSAHTLDLHHGKHHRGYVDKLNELLRGSELAGSSLEEIILAAADGATPESRSIFNNAAQHWNHSFFWNSLSPDGGGAPGGKLEKLIVRDFGSFPAFRDAFKTAAVSHFGSGWIWLAAEQGTLKLLTTHDAHTPLADGLTALVCCDLWEHAYYVDYENRRPDYIDRFLSDLVNWQFAAQNLDRSASDVAAFAAA